MKHYLSTAAYIAILAFAAPAWSQERSGNLGSGIADVAPGVEAPMQAGDPWGPTPATKTSLANLAPVLYAFVNNGPVFGMPGTVGGDIFHRSQLGGDWGGLRTRLAARGVFIDKYTTIAYEDVTSGGLEEGGHLIVNNQASLNLDTGRAGLWPGAMLHLTVQYRSGDEPSETFTSGASVPSYTGLVLPGPTNDDQVQASEYYILQALSPHFGLVAGKISDVFIPDQTAFANAYRYYFTNFNFNKNPMTTNFYGPTAWALLAAWKPTEDIAIAGGVLDPYTRADNFADHAFKDQNYYLMAIISYRLGNLPGQISPAFNWSNQPQLDLSHPYGTLALAQIPQAIGVLVGSPETEGLPLQTNDNSWFAIANISQYLWTPHTPQEIDARLRSGQPLRGVGVIGRIGYAPEKTNTVARDASIGLFARGLFDARPEDSIGVAYYYNGISDELKRDVAQLSAGTIKIHDERGAEVFYHLALTPAVRFIVSYQHIWDPLAAGAAADQDHADIVATRLSLAW